MMSREGARGQEYHWPSNSLQMASDLIESYSDRPAFEFSDTETDRGTANGLARTLQLDPHRLYRVRRNRDVREAVRDLQFESDRFLCRIQQLYAEKRVFIDRCRGVQGV